MNKKEIEKKKILRRMFIIGASMMIFSIVSCFGFLLFLIALVLTSPENDETTSRVSNLKWYQIIPMIISFFTLVFGASYFFLNQWKLEKYHSENLEESKIQTKQMEIQAQIQYLTLLKEISTLTKEQELKLKELLRKTNT